MCVDLRCGRWLARLVFKLKFCHWWWSTCLPIDIKLIFIFCSNPHLVYLCLFKWSFFSSLVKCVFVLVCISQCISQSCRWCRCRKWSTSSSTQIDEFISESCHIESWSFSFYFKCRLCSQWSPQITQLIIFATNMNLVVQRVNFFSIWFMPQVSQEWVREDRIYHHYNHKHKH